MCVVTLACVLEVSMTPFQFYSSDHRDQLRQYDIVIFMDGTMLTITELWYSVCNYQDTIEIPIVGHC